MPALRSLWIVAFGFGMLLLQSMVGRIAELHPFIPNLLLPIVIYLGVSPEVSLLRGTFTAFFLGYLLDLFSGNLMSLETFVCVATFLTSRGAGLRLFMRNPGFQAALVFVVALVAGGSVIALRAIFAKPAPFPAGTALDTAFTLFAPALATAVVSPLVFAGLSRVDSSVGRRREEAAS
ncbi:MAG: rod shape-determining protein MreD [Myxococcota bacterium]